MVYGKFYGGDNSLLVVINDDFTVASNRKVIGPSLETGTSDGAGYIYLLGKWQSNDIVKLLKV